MSHSCKLCTITLFSSLLAVTVANAAYAEQGAAPPRPSGFELVQIVVGEAPPEKERGKRAHHNKTHVKKDVTRDDTLDSNADTSSANNGNEKGGQDNPGKSNSK